MNLEFHSTISPMKKLAVILTSFLFFAAMPGITLAQDDTDGEAANTWIESTVEITPKEFRKALLWDLVPMLVMGGAGLSCLAFESDPRGDDPKANCLYGVALTGPLFSAIAYVPIDMYAEVPKAGVIAYASVKVLITTGVIFAGIVSALSGLSESISDQELYDRQWDDLRTIMILWASSMTLINGLEAVTQSVYIKEYNNSLAYQAALVPEIRGKDTLYLTLQYSF